MQYKQLTDACKPSEGKNHLMVAKFPDGEEAYWIVGRMLEDGVTYKVTTFHFLNTADPQWQEQGAVFYWAEIPRVS